MSSSLKFLVAITSLALAFSVSAPTQAQILGLDNTVIHLEGPSQTNDFVAAYNDYPLYTAPLSLAGIEQVATFVAGTTDGTNTYGSAASPTTEVNYLRYTYLDTADVFSFVGASNSTTSFLGADAAGVGTNGADVEPGNTAGTDLSSASSGFIDNASGYFDVLTAGQFTFTLTEADDQALVQIDGSNVVYTNYNNGTQTGTVTLSAGDHTFDLLYDQNGGGQDLEYSVTPGAATSGIGLASFQYTATETTAAVPEPSTWALMLGGLGLLVCWQRRVRQS